MHREQMVVSRSSLQALARSSYRVAVGTTSLRTLESIYWYGVKLINNEGTQFFIEKLYPYQSKDSLPSFKESIEAILQHMQEQNLTHLQGGTEIFIFPSYQVRSIQALITNFHLPQSTLILLVAALVGEDWRKIYQAALDGDYRFLSYGDSSLLFNPM
jgi:S-adenosylmethionine:tRNA ribosyltransferase-isomerase